MHQTQCSQHGLQEETFASVSMSLLAFAIGRAGRVLVVYRTRCRSLRDAWCSACRDRLAESGDEWTAEASAFASPKILCGQCYDDVRDLNLNRRHA